MTTTARRSLIVLLAAVVGFGFSLPVAAQFEGQMLCGYITGGFWSGKFMVAGEMPPCPSVEEAYTNPQYGGSSQCAQPGNLLPTCVNDKWFWVDDDGSEPPPDSNGVTAALVANPDTIYRGDSSVLTWDSTGATSCTGSGFSTGGQTSGTVSVSPTQTTTYVVTCTDGQTTGSSRTWVQDTDNDISDLDCSGGLTRAQDPNNTGAYQGVPTCSSSNPGGSACASEGSMCKWNVWAHPEIAGNCWIATDLYTCTTTGGSAGEAHSASRAATVTVLDTATLAASCMVSPTSIVQGGSATWTATASGGNGTYAYSWSGSDSLSGTSASVTKQYLTAGVKTGQVQVTSQGQVLTVACSNSLTVTSTTLPNLTADAVTFTPSEPVTGSPTTLRAVIRNAAATTTRYGFTDQFQINKGSIPASEAELEARLSYSSLALAANSNNTASASYTFPSSGDWYVRACADRTLSGSSPYSIVESNENDNCSPSWTLIEVCDADDPLCGGDPDELACSYQDASGDGAIDVNENVTFRASPSNLGSTAYTWDPSSGSTVSNTAYTYTRSFSAEGDYEMQVSASGYSADTCEFTVGDESCALTDLELTASPTLVERGDSATLRYSVSGVGTCTITSDKDSSYHETVSATVCGAETDGTRGTHAITTKTVFTLTCGAVKEYAEVGVVPDVHEI